MNETEVKILEVDREKVIDKLLELGAKKAFDDVIYAVKYDTPDKNLEKEKKMLRLRREGKKAVLTFKKNISKDKAKVSEEFEIEVPDFEGMSKILEGIGFAKLATFKKRRISYKIEDVHFEFDKYLEEYEKIPEFLEIEAKDIETLFRYLKLLGFKENDARPWSLLDVIKHYDLK